MKIYLAEIDVWNYTLTTWAFDKSEAINTLKKEWLGLKAKQGWDAEWRDREEFVSIYELEQNQVEWR